FEHILLNENAGSGRANLTLIDEYAEESAVRGRIKIRVREKDVWRFPAEFQRHFLEIGVGYAFQDCAAGFCSSSKRDLIHFHRLDDRAASDWAIACDDIEDTWRQLPNVFLNEASKFQRCQRSLLRGLEDDCAAGGKRWSQFPSGEHERIIPWHDQAGHTDRFAQRHVESIVGHWQCFAMNFRCKAAVVLEAASGLDHVEFTLDDRFSAIECFKFSQHRGVLAHQIRHSEQNASALLRGRLPPRAA